LTPFYRFFFIFKHSRAPKRSWKIFHGVPESPGKVLDFLSVKEWEPCLSLSLSLSILTANFPGEPGLAGVYWSKGWWRWW